MIQTSPSLNSARAPSPAGCTRRLPLVRRRTLMPLGQQTDRADSKTHLNEANDGYEPLANNIQQLTWAGYREILTIIQESRVFFGYIL